MNEKRCILCNRPYNYKYNMFGRGCLNDLYELLNFAKMPKIILNKESYLCRRIAWRNHKFFLNKSKKQALAKNYIALQYLNKMNYNSLNEIKENISKYIDSISTFSKNENEIFKFNLNDVYKSFKYYQKFNELMQNFEEKELENIDKELAEDFIKSISFIFDVSKKSNPIFYSLFYAMQYRFWQVVVVGGLLKNMKLSARLLMNSLAPFGKKPEDLVIDDEEIIKDIQDSEEFKEKIKLLAEKYCRDNNKFSGNSTNNEDCKIEFNDRDLFLAIHGSPISIDMQKNEDGTWDIDLVIVDTYDFTDFKNLNKYTTSNKSRKMSIFSTILNNLAVVSSEYGVIKPYKVTIKVQKNQHIIE